jgi:hypothetical protein
VFAGRSAELSCGGLFSSATLWRRFRVFTRAASSDPQVTVVAALSEDDRKTILGKDYRPPDPNAVPEKSFFQKMWAKLTGKKS